MIFNMGAGGASTAEAVQYDNKESGLEATNVQGALDVVTDSLETVLQWKLLGNTTGLAKLQLPTKYNEILVACKASGDDITVGNTIPYGITGKIDAGCYSAFTSQQNYNRTALVIIDNNEINLLEFLLKGTDVTATATATFYYR